MLHCPYCGADVKEDELFCINCGKKLPSDMIYRVHHTKERNKYWFMPLIAILLASLAIGTYYFVLQHQATQAKESFHKGEQELLEGNFEDALDRFHEAIKFHNNFPQATISIDFTNKALAILDLLEQADALSQNHEFQQALTLLAEAEQKLKEFNGDAVNNLIQVIEAHRNTIKIEKITNILNGEPTIDELKTLLWESESVGMEADEITATIRHQIVDYSFTRASELINEKQFREASLFVEDGMKYAPNSEKLISLKTTIDKEKVAFETAQKQRIEQAMSIAKEEYELNENNAVKLVSSTMERDEQGNFVVTGEVKSIATIPINSILVEYSLSNKGKESIKNEVFVYPDTLYPNQTGKFEFTHFNTKNMKDLKLSVNKITWYTEN